MLKGLRVTILFFLTSTFVFSSETIEKRREERELRYQEFNGILSHDRDGLAVKDKGQRTREQASFDDYRRLFCPQLFKKKNVGAAAFEFGAQNTGDSDFLDYLKSLNPRENVSASAHAFIRSVQGPMKSEVDRYEKLHERVQANSDTYKSFLARKRKHTYAIYKKQKVSKAESQALNNLEPQMNSQALSDSEEIYALNFEVNKGIQDKGPHPVINHILLTSASAFGKRLQERKEFLMAASRAGSLVVKRVDGSSEIVIGGNTFSLREIVKVGEDGGHTIAEDVSGNYFIVDNREEGAAYVSLCNPQDEKIADDEELDAKQIMDRILETGQIKLSDKECETLRKDMNRNSGDVGQYLAGHISASVDYMGDEAVEILIPTAGLSKDLKNSIDAVKPDLKKSEERVAEKALILNQVMKDIDAFLAEAPKPSSESPAVKTFDSDSVSLKTEQFIADALRDYEGEGIEPSIEELKKRYPRLIVDRPDLAMKFLEAHNASDVASRVLERERIKAQSFSNKDFVPLVIASDIKQAEHEAHFAKLYPDDVRSSTPIQPITSAFTYESHLNPETGNLEVYVCEEPTGEPDLPYKRLMSKPLFTVDKANVSPEGFEPGSYNGNLWAVLVDTLHCPGDPEPQMKRLRVKDIDLKKK